MEQERQALGEVVKRSSGWGSDFILKAPGSLKVRFRWWWLEADGEFIVLDILSQNFL